MSKISIFVATLGILSAFHSASSAARNDPSAAMPRSSTANVGPLDSVDDQTLEALAICPECKRRFLRDHKWTDTQYAELLEQRGKLAAPGDSKSTTGQ